MKNEAIEAIHAHYRPTQDEMASGNYHHAFERAKRECRNKLLRVVASVETCDEKAFVDAVLSKNSGTARFLTAEFVKRWFPDQPPSNPLPTDEFVNRWFPDKLPDGVVMNLDGKPIK